MDSEEYLEFQKNKLLNEFIEKYTRIIGHEPNISLLNEIRYPKINLYDLETIINTYIPKNIKSFRRINSIRHKSRLRELVELKVMFSYIAHNMKYKLVEIGRYMLMDHTTIIHHLKTFKNYMEYDPNFMNNFKKIENEIKKLKCGDKLLQSSFEESVDTKPALHTVLL